jgi:hypothetical protein
MPVRRSLGKGGRKIPVFFYGSFINVDVLKEVDLVPDEVRVAKLHGWDLHIGPLATLEPKDDACVYGVVVDCSHEELERLYAQDWVGGYLPEPVLVESDGAFLPALTYIKWKFERGVAARDYVERIAAPAETLGFPDWYVEHIRSFI